jgi:hypothetical protein
MRISVVLSALFLLAGCSREEVETYRVPKESVVSKPSSTSALQTIAPKPHSGFLAKLPKGWIEKPASGMRMASYAIEGTSIDFYLISLSMGDVSSNVNRWRGQVGLAPATAEAIAQEVQTFDVDGHAISYIEIYNEKGGKGIIAAIVDLSPQYWYFTAKGSSDELKAHAAQIRAFLESMEIN